MSVWINRRDAQGRHYRYSISIPPWFVVAVLVAFLTVLLDLAAKVPVELLAMSAGLLFLGFACFLAAKISAYRSGFWFSFGPARMTPRMRRLYRLGYVLMVPAALMILLLTTIVMRLHG